MESQTGVAGWLRRGGWLLLLIALVPLGLHLWANAHDNLFRDELYYLSAGQHLDWGYVEYPPFVALMAALTRVLLGTSVVAVRLLPALAQVAIVLLTASMVALLGGGLAAQALAAIAIALGPVFVGSSGLLTMDVFDLLWWALAAWTLVRMIKSGEPRWWLLFGAVIGVGLLTKLTIAFFVIALLLGLLLSQERKLLFNRWLIIGGLIALGIVWPYIAWQARHGFPVLEYTAAYASGKVYWAGPFVYLLQQIITMNPILLPLWLGGLYFLLFAASGRPYRAFGWAYLLLFFFFMLQKAKYYWLSPAYPMLFAAGAYGLQQLIERRPRLGWLQPTAIALATISGLLMVPLAIPMLPNETYIAYNRMMGGLGTQKQENLASSQLSQSYADRQGWREMVAAVKQAYDTLTPAEQADTCILTRNYGEAGAVDLYGAELGLPRAITGHNSYYIWGPQGCSGKVLISIGRPSTDLTGVFDSVEAGPAWGCDYCMPYEDGALIYIARGLQLPMEDAWPTTKDYN